ncbi:MAG: L,D-transpeptidase family protein [Acidobacteriota bacterium]
MRKLMILLAFGSAVSLLAQTMEVPPATPSARAIKAAIEEIDLGGYRSDVRNFYAPAGYRQAWSQNGQPSAQARAVIALFVGASEKGLDPADYALATWKDEARLDVALTAAAMRYASDLHDGRLDPRTMGFDLNVNARRLYLPALIAAVSESANPAALFAAVEPQSDEYRGLVAALATYRRIAAESEGQAALPVVEALKAGAAYAALPQLATALRRFGDLAADAIVNGNVYDGVMVAAVKRFQSRHGLAADGVLSKKTFAELNVPVSRRVSQLEWALERSRWAASDGPSIVVNIPEFRLRATDGADTLSMRVVVGKAAGHRTPVLEGDVRTVVFRPYWSVPTNIQRNEILPKVERDADWLVRHGYEIVDENGQSLGTTVDAATIEQLRALRYRVRQKPGPSNALGLVKFVFPNQSDVYLHSTPEQSLFGRTRRDFSHGCVRVEDPVALASWALRQSPEKVRAAIGGDEDDQYIRLERAVRVMIVYSTAAIGENGEVRFFADIYGHDATLAAALRNEHATPSGGLVLAAK